MPKEISPIGQAAINLLETKDWTFEQQTLEAAQSQIAAQEALEQQADTRIMLGNEAAALMDRMQWLNRHRLLGRLAGCKAAILPGKWEGLTTSPMFTTKPEYIGDGTQSEYVSDSYVFKSGWTDPFQSLRYPPPRGYEVLTIDRQITGQESGIEEPVEEWAVCIYRDAGKLIEVSFNSTATNDHKSKNEDRIFKRYLRKNPWLEYYCNASANTERPVVKRDILAAAAAIEDPWADPTPLLYARSPVPDAEKKSVVEELEHELTRGVGWDYDEDVYLFPLGLISQARAQLGRRQIFPKMIK